MGELQEMDVEAIVERIRQNVRQRGGAEREGSPLRGLAPPPNGHVVADFSILHSGYDVQNVHFTSHRRILGSFVVFAKKLLRRLFSPILERQVAYNASNARVATYLRERIEGLAREQALFAQTVRERIETFVDQQTRMRYDVETFIEQQTQMRQEVLGGHAQRLQIVKEQVSRMERKVRRIVHLLTDDQEAREARVTAAPALRALLAPDFDYVGFEDQFRGSEEDIKRRQEVYVESFKGQDGVLDIGCGRGEFLELLREAAVHARGVDLDLDMVLYCREKGLDVVKGDAFACLSTLPDDSLGGVFAAQVIEHLEPSQMIGLVRLCHAKLRVGGVLIVETPNPACLAVFANGFYQDFSHVRPVHPAAMKFLLVSIGFEDVQVTFSAPVEAGRKIPYLPDVGAGNAAIGEFNSGLDRVNDLLFGFQDYAVIARKRAAV